MYGYENDYKRLLKKIEEIGGKDCYYMADCDTFPKCQECDTCFSKFKKVTDKNHYKMKKYLDFPYGKSE